MNLGRISLSSFPKQQHAIKPTQRIESLSNSFFFFVVENYGSLKSEVSDSTDGSEADRIIIINKPQTQQFCNNKIRWDPWILKPFNNNFYQFAHANETSNFLILCVLEPSFRAEKLTRTWLGNVPFKPEVNIMIFCFI